MRRIAAALVISLVISLLPLPVAAQQLAAILETASEDAYVGEQFAVQIRVEGSSSPKPPSLAEVKDFDVRSLGGQVNNAEYVSIVNNKVTRSSTQGYVFTYQFTARRAGVLVIPSIAVEVDGRTLKTEPRRITVTKPSEAADFHLVVEPSTTQPYVGEGFTLTATWFIAAPVRNVYFSVPFLADNSFRFITPEVDTTPSGSYYQAAVNAEGTVVEMGQAAMNGTTYTTARFTKTVTPLAAGTYAIPESNVQFEAQVGKQRQRSIFDSLFDMAGGDYRPFVVSSRAGSIRVRPLPTQGAPPGFAGHVGMYKIEASATPAEATVGDPITLTLTLSGPANVMDAPAPVLAGQRLARDFVVQDTEPLSVPATADTGSVPRKSYAYTIRASRAGVTGVPPVELPYFNPRTSRYEVARSAAVPVRIVKARVVTSEDAEGEPEPEDRPEPELEDSAEHGGIAHNYEDAGALVPQERGLAGLVRKPFPLVLVLLSLVSIGTSAALTTGRRRLADRASKGRGPFRALSRHLRQIAGHGQGMAPAAALGSVLSSLTSYFVRRLRLPPGAGTSGDVEAALKKLDTPAAPLGELADVFRFCEAGRYAGYNLSPETVTDVARRALAACTAIEEHLAARRASARRAGASAGTTALLLAGLLLCPGRHIEAEAADARELLAQATEAFRSANEAAQKNPAQAGPLYATAARLYERIAADGPRQNGKLYYNLGNAYYRLGDLGRAILAYRRAELYAPADSNLRRNLAQARIEREDTIQSRRTDGVARILLFWHHDFAPGTRALLSCLFLAAGAGFLSAWFFRRTPLLLRLAVIAAVPALLFLASLTADDIRLRHRREGVIIASEITARRGDGEIYQAAFQKPLHAGTEFVLREERHSWYLIEIADGRTCWIPTDAGELITGSPGRSGP